ncbi:MAG: hypothetical protein GX779_00615 [Clostridia bacterium]|jgi:hypothetical protein|nr:hypothetical protein [Clostridia bacterium]
MENPKLDRLLKTAKKQSERFFARWDDKLSPRMVLQRSREQKPWNRCLYLSKSRLGAAVACILLFLAVAFQLASGDNSFPPGHRPESLSAVDQEDGLSSDHPAFNLLLAEDFIPESDLGIKGGILIGESSQGAVTKIIPYQLNRRGELVLSADRVLLQVGEELLLIGINLPHQVDIGQEGYYLKRISVTDTGYIFETRFSVHSPGEGWLQITPKRDPMGSKIIFVKAID